jgi:hypothetical protein
MKRGFGGLLLRSLGLGVATALVYLAASLSGAFNAKFIQAPLFALHDFAARYRASGNQQDMPNTLLVLVDNRELQSFTRRTGRIPAVLSADDIAGVVEQARRHRIPLVALDIDLAIERPAAEEALLVAALIAWRDDPGAGALLLVRGDPCGPDEENCPRLSTPYDTVVAGAENIAWTSASVQTDFDGTLRAVDLRQRRSGDRSVPRDYPYIAHLAATVWRSFLGPNTITPARNARGALAQYVQCRRAASSWTGCLLPGADTGTASAPITPSFELPTLEALEQDAEGNDHSRLDAITVSTFLRGTEDDWRNTPLFVGASHFRSADRFETPFGALPGVLVVAGAAAKWAKYGVPQPSSRLQGMILTALWSSLIAFLILALERSHRQESERPFGPRRKFVARLLHPSIAVPAVLLTSTLFFFLATVRTSEFPENWTTVVLTTSLLSLVLAFREVRLIFAGRKM